ncbi:site-specific integrase [Chryseobacterium sp. SSA4.19]|uniref:tyrosine-type recombinase/integrase n=1 Tax=Chryseobacterium sp. SSA4.19 TaxID=2919915 RepID=UPI001F4D9584|nr:site-specific integrase [Chryseobacterium sp. SSA4.19]MCJ8153263.1 site-specific integrase [Chryseobacterium sp. SSA4.19]
MKSHSEIKVTPRTWEKPLKSNLEKTWEIYYTFYDRQHPDGVKIRFKGMNRAKSLEEKQAITKSMIENEIKNLQRGFNPIIGEYVVEDENLITEITPFIKACEIALKCFQGVESTMIDLNNSLKHIRNYATILSINNKDIKSVSKGDIKQLLMRMSVDKHSNYRVNKTRAHLSKFFAHFTELDIFQVNFIEGISKLEHTSKKKKIIRTEADWKKFHKIKDLNYSVYIFLNIFLYSGCRFEEMIQIKKEDVNLEKSFFWINLKKGGKHTRAMRPINMHVWKYWKRIFEIAQPLQYMFSFEQMPNDNPVKAHSLYDLSGKYLRKVGLDMTGYGLKHTFLNLVSKDFGISKAAEIAGHTSTKTTEKYAVDWQEHQVERNKKIDISI